MRYVALVGFPKREPGAITVSAPRGVLRVEGTEQELDELSRLLAQLDGRVPLQLDALDLSRDEIDSVLDGLLRIDGLIDLEQAWRFFHSASSNPGRFPPAHDPMSAYSLPRWNLDAPGTEALPEHRSPLAELAAARHSTDLATHGVRGPSFDVAIRIAAEAYRIRGPRRTVASAGALYPLHFWVVAGSEHSERQVVAVDHDRGAVVPFPGIGDKDFIEAFLPDRGVDMSLARGDSVIVIAADTTRTMRKYGNRGYRYILMEVGAAMHHMYLEGAAINVGLRAVAGFDDTKLSRLVCPDHLAMVTVFVVGAPACPS